MAFGVDQVAPLYVSAFPPRSTAAQNAGLGQDTATIGPVASTRTGGDHVEPL